MHDYLEMELKNRVVGAMWMNGMATQRYQQKAQISKPFTTSSMVKIGEYYQHRWDKDVWRITENGDSDLIQGICIESGKSEFVKGYTGEMYFNDQIHWERILYKSEHFKSLYDKLSS